MPAKQAKPLILAERATQPYRRRGSVAAVVLALACAAWASEDFAARRSQVQQMSPAEQQELLRRQERFLALSPEEQQHLRKLQADIDGDPHAKQLQRVLSHYHEWLKTLTPSQRAELADLAPAERVAQIKRLKQQQETARQHALQAELLSRKDMQEIIRWTEDILWAHRDRVLEDMSAERREAFDRLDTQRQRHSLLYFAYDRNRKPGQGGALGMIHQKDITKLADKLSPPAKEALTQASAVQAQKRMILGWLSTSMHRTEQRPSFRKPPAWADDEMVQFFQKDLKQPDRERLLKMPREQMLEEMRKLYSHRERSEDGNDGEGRPGRFRGGPGERSKGPRPPSAKSEKSDSPDAPAKPVDEPPVP